MKVIATEKAPGAIGPYSQGFVTNGFVYTSGQIPVNPADGTIPAGIAAQAQQSCKNVGAILEAGGSRPAMDSFKAFRGREPRLDALLRHQGMADAPPARPTQP